MALDFADHTLRCIDAWSNILGQVAGSFYIIIFFLSKIKLRVIVKAYNATILDPFTQLFHIVRATHTIHMCRLN